MKWNVALNEYLRHVAPQCVFLKSDVQCATCFVRADDNGSCHELNDCTMNAGQISALYSTFISYTEWARKAVDPIWRQGHNDRIGLCLWHLHAPGCDQGQRQHNRLRSSLHRVSAWVQVEVWVVNGTLLGHTHNQIFLQITPSTTYVVFAWLMCNRMVVAPFDKAECKSRRMIQFISDIQNWSTVHVQNAIILYRQVNPYVAYTSIEF